jgi:hypothetical protein
VKKAKKTASRRKKTDRQIQQIRRQIMEIGLVCPGTLSKRFNTCGKPNCRCAHDPKARHGPYYDWTRREKGGFVHSLVSASQAEDIKRAIKNHRRIVKLLAQWGRASAQLILAHDGRK